jgi:rhamnulokinase
MMMQAIATGRLASVAEGRAMIRRSFPMKTYEPREQPAWTAAYARLREML